MEKSHDFQRLYRHLENYLRQNIELRNGSDSIGERLRALANDYPQHRQDVEKLRSYIKLRNTLTHYSGPGGEWIAEPTEQSLREFEQLVQAITSPPKITSIGNSDLCLFFPQDPLINVLQCMGSKEYSQVIIQAEGKLSLLTVEEIARWLEKQALKGTVHLQGATIADAQEDQSAKNVDFLSQDQTIDDAKKKFMLALEEGKPRIYALLVTDNGEPTGTPLCIITPWDLIPH